MKAPKIHLSHAGDDYTACGRSITANVPVMHDALTERIWHVDCNACLRTNHARQIIAGRS